MVIIIQKFEKHVLLVNSSKTDEELEMKLENIFATQQYNDWWAISYNLKQ